MKLVAALIVALIALAPLSANAKNMWEDAAQVPDAFHEALAKGERDAALALLDDNVQIYEQGWVEKSKAEYAASHLDSDIAFAKATTTRVVARSNTMDMDVCYLMRELRTTGTFDGKPVDSITLETMILRRVDDGWRIVHIHWSSRKPKP